MCRFRIYIVEDNAIELGGFIAMIDELGYEVVGTSKNGEDAIKDISLFDLKPDIVLMDVNLPKMNGFLAA